MNKLAFLTLLILAAGCARADLPKQSFTVAVPYERFSACVFRAAQSGTQVSEPVTQTVLTDPDERQISKTYHGQLVWEVDVTPAGTGSNVLTRYHPGLLGWDSEMMRFVDRCRTAA